MAFYVGQSYRPSGSGFFISRAHLFASVLFLWLFPTIQQGIKPFTGWSSYMSDVLRDIDCRLTNRAWRRISLQHELNQLPTRRLLPNIAQG